LGYSANDDGAITLRLVITTTETQPVNFTISSPGINFIHSGTVKANEWSATEIPLEAEIRSVDDQYKGIYLTTSSDKVDVFGENIKLTNDGHTIGTFNVLPVTRLNVDQYVYFGMSLSRDNGKASTIVVVGTAVNTVMELVVTQSVEVKIKDTAVSLIPGRGYLFTINWLQTVFIASSNDLSGTKIITNKPVAVFSGHQCSNIIDVDGCDHIVEQIPPTVLWDTEHYVAFPVGNGRRSIKILAANDATTVDLFCDTQKENFVINEGETFAKTFESIVSSCAVQSSKEVLVSQFGHRDNTAHFMVLVPGTVHYSSKFDTYTIYDENFPSDEHYVNVIVLAQFFQPEMIYLMTGTKNETLNNWMEIKADDVTEAYSAHTLIPYGVSTILHADPSALMTVMIYGFSDTITNGVNLHTAYGHYGSLNQKFFLRTF